jgi:branched-chain amino acid transport system substrate-binding protein
MLLSSAVSALALWSRSNRAFARQEGDLRLGSLCPLTGAGAAFGAGMQRAMTMAAQVVNQAGGVLGRPLALFNEDDQTNPDAGVRAAKKLIAVNNVQAILGTWASGVTMAVAPLCIADRIVNMNLSGSTEVRELKSDGYVWQCIGSNLAYGAAFAAYARESGIRRASFMADNNPSGLTLADEFKRLMKDGGVDVNVVVYNSKQTTYRAELGKALQNNPELIALGSYVPETAIILKEAFEMNVTPRWVGPSWAVTPALLEKLPSNVTNGVVGIGAVPNMQHPKYEEFRKKYETETKDNLLSNPYSAVAFDMVIICALATESAKSVSAGDFHSHIRSVTTPGAQKVFDYKAGVTALRKGERIHYVGFGGLYEFDETGETRPLFGRWVAKDGKLNLDAVFKA